MPVFLEIFKRLLFFSALGIIIALDGVLSPNLSQNHSWCVVQNNPVKCLERVVNPISIHLKPKWTQVPHPQSLAYGQAPSLDFTMEGPAARLICNDLVFIIFFFLRQTTILCMLSCLGLGGEMI
jgi:hypothetical protein